MTMPSIVNSKPNTTGQLLGSAGAPVVFVVEAEVSVDIANPMRKKRSVRTLILAIFPVLMKVMKS